jgi:hypothetical protein
MDGVASELQGNPGAAGGEMTAVNDPPFVVDVFGEIAPNGNAIGLSIQRSTQGPVELCLRSEDIQYFITLILALSHEAKRLRPVLDAEAPPKTAIPLPITALNVGQTSDDRAP